ncbi:hypothetical protein P3L10_033408 [Capsicum annuum]
MEEIKSSKQQMVEMYEAWLNGQASPSSNPRLSTSNDPNSDPAQTNDPFYPPEFGPFANMTGVAGTFTMHSPNSSVTNNPFLTSVAPATAGTQPTVPTNTDTPIVVEKIAKNEEQEEMARKVRILEQSMLNMQGFGGPKSVSYKDLCMFPDVHLPIGFKMPKFYKYEGHGDPVAHLKTFCNQLRGAEGKEKSLMAYFRESLTGIAFEWFIDQDISHWHVWDDMARDFVQQFQYNIEIVPNCTTLANMIKKMTESFREYAIRWREQDSRVRPSIKESKMIDIFLLAQKPNYFHYLLSTIGSIFAKVIKVREMVENRINGPGKNMRGARQPYAQNLLYFIPSLQYPIYNAQPYARAPSYLQLRKMNMVESSDAPNVSQNPLPDHNETNMLEVILSGEDATIFFKPIIRIKIDSEKSANVVDLTKEKPAEVEVVITKPESSNVPLMMGKEISENIGSSQIKPKLIIPGRSNKPLLIIKRSLIAPIVITPVSQLPMVNTKAVCWNYNRVVVMHKGKEVTEDVDEVWGLTRSGRCYAQVELRKNKQGSEE